MMDLRMVSVMLGLGCATGMTVSEKVLTTPNLVAFWDFQTKDADGYFAAQANVNGYMQTELYPVKLRSGLTGQAYTEENWPNPQRPVIKHNIGGPFGRALNVYGSELFANVERSDFANTPLDISGYSPFTLLAWVFFPVDSHKHHIAGIWDEGSWDKYSGQRQYSLFRINRYGPHLFGHISATGASSYPQSNSSGAQYARVRALNGAETLTEGEWHQIAMTYDGSYAKSFQDAVSKPYSYYDQQEWVEQSVYKGDFNAVTNPKAFDWGVFHPLRFIVKFNGYSVEETGVFEHYVRVDLKAAQRTLTYGVKAKVDTSDRTYTVLYRFVRGEADLPFGTGQFFVSDTDQGSVQLPSSLEVQAGDRLILTLRQNVAEGIWTVGSPVTREIGAGAPFSFGRVLGHGTEMLLSGVAMYNRVLSDAELKDLVSGEPATPPLPPTPTQTDGSGLP
eukprot:TRINITY_DN1640_c0_g1_i4.p1 TRINITY_DN1640_c0_g1~~TRINITY_DN1640_c0_g1_i4.p1  ORF type:complete len:448 (+),score=82.84 TRINITY_DN1640_c0_g1_i4:71-1414(+)